MRRTNFWYSPYVGKIDEFEDREFMVDECETCCFCYNEIGEVGEIVALDIELWGSGGCHKKCLSLSEEI